MPSFNIIKNVELESSFRVAQVQGMFDIPVSEKIKFELNCDIPFEEKEWQIGLIFGPSGAGKSLIAKQLFSENYFTGFKWDNKSVIENIQKNIDTQQIIEIFNSVGFSSAPSWLKPFSVLSNGEKFRVELARCILENKKLTVYDEFTSVVDRNVAKIGSNAVAKAIRKYKKQFIAVSCHYDIIDWLCPDWTYQVDSNEFKWRSLRRPEIKLELYRTSYKSWKPFAKYHYLTHEISCAAICFLCYWENELVAFTSALHHPGFNKGKLYRGHRTVVFPDYQGVGIGNAMVKMMARYFKSIGAYYRATTAAKGLIEHRLKRPNEWKLIKAPSSRSSISKMRPKTSEGRLTCTFEYIGD